MFRSDITCLHSVLEASLGCVRPGLKSKQAKRYSGTQDQGLFPLPSNQPCTPLFLWPTYHPLALAHGRGLLSIC